MPNCNKNKLIIKNLVIVCCLTFLMLLTSCNVETTTGSNEYTITGTVYSSDYLSGAAEGLKNVKISITNTNIHTITDANGNYTLTKVPGTTIVLQAEKEGMNFIPDFSSISKHNNTHINVLDNAKDYVIENANFFASNELTISQIQGRGHRSPLEGQKVVNIKGYVTQVTTLKYHPNDNFKIVDYMGNVKRQTVGEDGFYMQMIEADGDPLTSDGIFVSTRDPKGAWGQTKWLPTCLKNGKMPNPGDIVTVTGIVEEKAPVDRFDDSTDLPTRTQINATSVTYTNTSMDIGRGITLTYDDTESNDNIRILPFNESGLSSLGHMADVLETVEGMLVKVNNPIVTGASYYNITPFLADGGKDKNGNHPTPFNEKWLSPIVAENDLNSELLYAYYDCTGGYPGPLPQTGTILTNDENETSLTGIMDFSSEGVYMIYPFQTLEGQNKAKVNCGIHNNYNFIVNPDSFYYAYSKEDFPLTPGTRDIQDLYKPWIYSDSTEEFFTVPWKSIGFNEEITDSNEKKMMNVAVFNIENYIAQGSKYKKINDITNAIRFSLKYPDLIIFVEMGDDDDTGNNGEIIYKNQNHSYIRPTGVVSARQNYETLIAKIKKCPEHIEYDYRQIDPIEFDQAGSPGNNIRVGFMFRTDRIKAYDIGLETNHIGHVYDHLIDFPEQEEIGLTRLAKTNTHVLKDEEGNVTLSQSPGFVQNDAFYHSRIPLACKFNFIPTGEDFFAVAAHLYSKGPDATPYGTQQPPVFSSDIRRTNQAIALHNFIYEILEADPDAKIIVGGDMNDFGFSPAVKRLTGETGGTQILYSYTEEFMPQEEIFTYTYRGNLQQLDHIFVSRNLFSKVGNPDLPSEQNKKKGDTWKNLVHIPHINSLFSRDKHIQISDHDPLAARIDMSK